MPSESAAYRGLLRAGRRASRWPTGPRPRRSRLLGGRSPGVCVSVRVQLGRIATRRRAGCKIPAPSGLLKKRMMPRSIRRKSSAADPVSRPRRPSFGAGTRVDSREWFIKNDNFSSNSSQRQALCQIGRRTAAFRKSHLLRRACRDDSTAVVPAPGPRSITQSAPATIRMSCSATTTVLPASTRRCS